VVFSGYQELLVTPVNQTLEDYIKNAYVKEALKQTNMETMGLNPTMYGPYYNQSIYVKAPLVARRASVDTGEVELEEPISEPASETAARMLPFTGVRIQIPRARHLAVNYSIAIPPTAPVYAATNMNTIQQQVLNQSYISYDSELRANLQTAAQQQGVTDVPVTLKTIFIEYGQLQHRPITTTTVSVVVPVGVLSAGDSDSANIAVIVILSLIFLCVCFAGIFYLSFKNKKENQKEENNVVVEEASPPFPAQQPVVPDESGIQAVPKTVMRYEEDPEEPEETEMPEDDAARVSDV